MARTTTTTSSNTASKTSTSSSSSSSKSSGSSKSDTSAYWQNLQVSANTEEEKRNKILAEATKDLTTAAEIVNQSTSGSKSKSIWTKLLNAVESLNEDGKRNNKLF